MLTAEEQQREWVDVWNQDYGLGVAAELQKFLQQVSHDVVEVSSIEITADELQRAMRDTLRRAPGPDNWSAQDLHLGARWWCWCWLARLWCKVLSSGHIPCQ